MGSQEFNFNPWHKGDDKTKVVRCGNNVGIILKQDPETGKPIIGYSPTRLAESQLPNLEKGIAYVRKSLMPKALERYERHVKKLKDQISTEQAIEKMREKG